MSNAQCLSRVALVILLAFAVTAQAQAPEITGEPEAGLNQDQQWEIRWQTDAPSIGQVEYGSDDSYGRTTEQQDALDGNHVHVLEGLEPDTTYHYRLVVRDWSGNEVMSESRTFTAPELAAPESVTAAGAGGQARLSWTPVFGATGYRIERGLEPGGPYEEVATSEEPSYTDSGLEDEVTYYYVVTSLGQSAEAQSEEVSVTPHPLAGNLVGAWLFDEGEGDTVSDASGHGHHGSFHNASWVEGQFGSAARIIPGENYLEVENTEGLSPADELTITVWIYLEDLPDVEEQFPNRRILQAGSYNPDELQYGIEDNHYRFLFEFGEFIFQAGPNAQPDRVAIDQGEAIVLGQWSHLAGVYAGEHIRLYVNGELISEIESSGAELVQPENNRLFIGTKSPQAPAGDWWDGLIDEVAIFDRVLSEEEIRIVMQGLSGLVGN
jgi:hypothetical protein